MGRHSAPEDVAPDTAPVEAPATAPDAAATTAEPAAAGRHSRPEPDIMVKPARVPVAAGSRGDLHLLRTDRGLLLRSAGAVVLAFLSYSCVLVLLGRGDVYPVWVWIPTVLSGVSVGALLDAAHSRLNRAATPSAEAAAQQDAAPPS